MMANVSDEFPIELGRLTRELRHRLESLRRAGIDRIPTPPVLQTVAARPVTPVEKAPEPEPEAPRPAKPPVVPKPSPAPIAVASLFGTEGMEKSPVVPAEERP